MGGQARASYPEKTPKKNDQTPPPKNPSYHTKVGLVCGGGVLHIISFKRQKNGISGWGDSPPTHQHTNTHAPPTRARRNTRRGHAQPTHTANTHTGRGLGGRDDSQHREGASFLLLARVPGHQHTRKPRSRAFFAHNRRRSGSVLVWINTTNFIIMSHTTISRFVRFLVTIVSTHF